MNLDRRNFLKGAVFTGALAAGGAIAGCAPSSPSSQKETSDSSETFAQSTSGEYMNAAKAAQKWEFEVPPEPITDVAETIQADVVVVGAGTSGLVTAYSALQEGLNVIVVSASSKPISRGGSNNAIYSKEMEKRGIPRQDPFIMVKEMAQQGNNLDTRKWYRYYHNSEEAMNWMIDIMEGAGYRTGIEINSGMVDDSLFYQPLAAHGWYNEENQSIGMTQPFVVNTLAEKIEAEGGKIYYKNIGRQLVRGTDNASGRVSAIICEREDGSYAKYEAAKAVVLATGDFSASRDMMAKYCPQAAYCIDDDAYDEVDYDKEFVLGGLYPGDGQKMGLWVGAAWQKSYPNAPMGASLNAGAEGAQPGPYQNFWGLMVNREGQRFMDEYCSCIMGGRVQTLQPGGESIALWDSNYCDQSPWYLGQGGLGIIQSSTPDEVRATWEKMVENGAYVKADTIEELCEKLELPTEETKATIDRYNQMCDAKEDTDFFKRPENLLPIKTAPFYGNKASGIPAFFTVLGGLRTDDMMRVCDEDDNPIEGLYNVGTMIGDFYSGYYTFQMEGINYGACCLTFGYLTGKFIASNE
nr:FAD-dependent oxidoreductase [uncultured Adlercreutzia sp.]